MTRILSSLQRIRIGVLRLILISEFTRILIQLREHARQCDIYLSRYTIRLATHNATHSGTCLRFFPLYVLYFYMNDRYFQRNFQYACQ